MSIRKREHAHEARCHLPVLLPLGEGSWLAFARCKTPYETIIMSACACMPITNCRTHKSASLHGPAIKFNGRPSVLGETQLLCLDSEPNTSFGLERSGPSPWLANRTSWPKPLLIRPKHDSMELSAHAEGFLQNYCFWCL